MSLTKLIVISNPFDPEIAEFDLPEGKKIGELVKDLENPYVFLNKEHLSEIDPQYVLKAEDELIVFVEPGEAFTLFLSIAALALAVATTIYFLTQLPDEPDQLEKSPTYSLSASRNAARLGEAIPVQYGEMRVYPDLLAAPWIEYQSNEQYLHQMFMIGKGEYDVSDIRLADTPITSFDDVTTQVVYEGPVTLFPDNVESSVEVANQELSTSNTGPFIVNAANTDVYRISIDVVFAEGIYRARSSGKIQAVSNGTIIIEYQEIDDSGTPIGVWTLGTTGYVSGKSLVPLRQTYTFTVSHGRYQVRVRRSNPQNSLQQKVHDRVLWEGMRGFIVSDITYDNCTLLAVRMRATEQLSSLSSRSFNVFAKRKVPIRSGGSWTSAQLTRNPAWAITDIARNSDYGAGRADSEIDNAAFEAFATWCTTNGFNFDGRFDTITNIWKAMEQIAAVGRGYMVTAFDLIGVKAENTQNLPAWTFNRANIRNEKFQLTYDRSDDYDSVESRYLDEENDYLEDVLLTSVTGTSLNPREIDFRRGITNRDHLYKINKFLAGKEAYANLVIEFDTELEGYLPERGDLISVATDVIGDLSIAGEVVEYSASPSPYVILSQELTTDQAVQHGIVLRQRDGTVSGPHNGTIDSSNPAKINLSAALGWDPSPVDGEYNVIAAWGEVDYSFREFIVSRVLPKSENEITIEATIYDARVYDLTGTAPAPAVRPELPKVAERPNVYNIRFENTAIPNRVGISWQADQGWNYFAWQTSDDGSTWSRSRIAYEPYVELEIDLNDVFNLYFRVRAVGEFAGDWVSSSLSNAGSTDYTAPDTAVSGLTDPLSGADYDMETSLEFTWNADNDIPQFYWSLEDANNEVFLDGFTTGNSVTLSQSQIVACGQAAGRVSGRIGIFGVYPASFTQSTNFSLGQTVNINNAQMPAPNNVTLTEGFNAFSVSTTVTSPPNDFKGMRIFVGTTPSFTPDPTINMVYDGDFNPVVLVPANVSLGTTLYVRVDLYDIFGKDNTSLYSELTITITKNVEADYIIPQQFGSSIIQNSYLDQGRVRSTGELLPAGWYLNGTASTNLQYSDSDRDKVLLTPGASGVAEMISSAFVPNINATYEVTVRIRSTSGTPTVSFGVYDKYNVMSPDKTAITATSQGAFIDPQIDIYNGIERSTTAVLSTAFSLETYTYTPAPSSKWASVFVRADANEEYEIDYIYIRDASVFSANASRTLALRKNWSLDGYSPGDLILVGFNSVTNAYDPTTDGTFIYDGTEYTVIRDQFSAIVYQDVTITTNPTYSAGKIGYIVYNPFVASFSVNGTTVYAAFAWRTGNNTFSYDRFNTAPGNFTGSNVYLALGWMKMSSDGTTIDSAGLFAEPIPINVAPDPTATIGATLGTNLFESDGTTLIQDVDIRNDEVILDQLPAINTNPSFRQFTDRNGTPGPVGWIGNSTNQYPTYTDVNERDVILCDISGMILVNTAIRANPNTTYEFLAAVRAVSTPGSYIDLRAEELTTTPLPTGIRFIANNVTNWMIQRDSATEVVSNGAITTGSFSVLAGDYTPGNNVTWFSPSIYDSNTGNDYEVEWFIVRDKSIDKAVVGQSLYASDETTLLADIDIRNDELVTEALSALNANPSFELSRRNTDDTLAPASWFSAYSNRLEYEDDNVRDVLFLPGGGSNYGAVNAAFPVVTGSVYKVTVLVKHTGVNSGQNTFSLAVIETSDDLDTGERAIYNSTPGGGDPSSLFHTANTTVKVLVSQNTTTSYAIKEQIYVPSNNAKWASVALFDTTDNDLHFEWVVVRAGGATTGVSFYDPSGDPLYAGENSPSIGGLLFNGSMFQIDYERDAPTGWYLTQSTDATALTTGVDGSNRILVLGDGTSNQFRANSTAFQVNPNATYRLSVRLRGSTSSAAGLYIRMVEYDSDLPEGKIVVATNASTSPTPGLIQEDTREANTVNGLLTRISGGTDWEDDPVTSGYTEYVGTYRPSSTAKWAGVQILNWTNFTGYLYIDRISINIDAGALASKDAVDYDTEVNNTPVLGDLAGQDTVGQLDIDNYSVHRVSFNSNSTGINLRSTGAGSLVTAVDVTLAIPSNKSNSAVLLEAEWQVAGSGTQVPPNSNYQYQDSIGVRFRNVTSNQQILYRAKTFLYVQKNHNDAQGDLPVAYTDMNMVALCGPSLLSAGVTNTFRLEFYGIGTSDPIWNGFLNVDEFTIRATLLNGAQ